MRRFVRHFFRTEPEGRIYRENVVAGLHLRMHPGSVVLDMLHVVEADYLRRESALQDPKTDELRKALVVEAVKSASGPKRRSLVPRFAQNAVATPGRKFATVQSIASVSNHLLDKAAIDDIRRLTDVTLPTDSGGSLTGEEWERLVGSGPWRFPLRKGAQLGGALLWFTAAEEVERIRAAGTAATLAERLRDAFGLCHYPKATGLVVVRFDGDVLSGRDHYRPVFIDAPGQKRFKLRHSVDDAGEPATWGHTADLVRLETTGDLTAHIDGVQERVVTPLLQSAFNGAMLEFEPVGVTTTTRAEEPFTHNDFLARLVFYNERLALPGGVMC